MAEQREVVILQAQDATGKAVSSANANLASVEATAGRVGNAVSRTLDAAGQGTVRIVSRTQKQIDAIVAQTERRLLVLKNPLERLAIEQKIKLSQVAGDPIAVAKVNSVFKELTASAVAAEAAAAKALATTADKGFGARIAEFITSPTYAARKSLGEFLETYGKFGIIAGSTLLAVGVAVKGTFDFIREAGKSAEEITNLASRLGVSAREASLLSSQARITGVSVESLGGLVRKLSTDLADGGNESRQTVRQLQAIGIAVADAGGKFRSPTAIIEDFSAQLDKLPDHARQVDLLTRTFGRQAVELLPLIKNFKETQAAAREAGIPTEDLVRRLARVDDALDVVGIKYRLFKLQLAEKVITGLDSVATAFEKIKNADLTGPVFQIAGLAAGIAGAVKVLPLLGGALGGIVSGLGSVAVNASRAWLALFDGGIVGARALGGAIGPILTTLKTIVTLDFAAAAAGIANMARAATALAAARSGAFLTYLGEITLFFQGGAQGLAALSGGAAILLSLGTAALVAGAAFAGWKLGQWLYENSEAFKVFEDKIEAASNSLARFLGLKSFETSGFFDAANRDAAQITAFTKALIAMGVEFEKQGSRTIPQYAAYLVDLAQKHAKLTKAITDGFPKTTANRLVDQFNSGLDSGLDGLERRLQNLQREKETIDTAITKTKTPESPDETVRIKDAIAASRAKQREIESVKDAIRTYGALDAAQKAAHATYLKSLRDEQTELVKFQEILFGTSDIDLKRIEGVTKATEAYAEAIAKAKSEGQYRGTVPTDLRLAFEKDFQAATVRDAEERIKNIEEEGRKNREYYSEKLKLELQFQAQTIAIRQATTNSQLDYEETIAGQIRDSQLRAIEAITPRVLAEKIRLEIAKGQIETEYAGKSLQIRLDSLDRESEASKRLLEAEVTANLITNQQYQDRVAAMDEDTTQKERQFKINAAADVARAQEEAVIRANQAIIESNTQVFDTFKRESEGVLDAMFTKGQNIFQALGNSIKAAFLTALKDVVSSRIAASLTQLVTGQKVSLVTQTLGTGPLAKLASAIGLGARPVFGGLSDIKLIGGAVPVVVQGGLEHLVQERRAAAPADTAALHAPLASLAAATALLFPLAALPATLGAAVRTLESGAASTQIAQASAAQSKFTFDEAATEILRTNGLLAAQSAQAAKAELPAAHQSVEQTIDRTENLTKNLTTTENKVLNEISNKSTKNIENNIVNETINKSLNRIENSAINSVENNTVNRVVNETANSIENAVSNAVKNNVENAVKNFVTNSTEGKTINRVLNDTANKVVNQSENKILSATTNAIANNVENQTRNEVLNRTQNSQVNEEINKAVNTVESGTVNRTENSTINRAVNELQNQTVNQAITRKVTEILNPRGAAAAEVARQPLTEVAKAETLADSKLEAPGHLGDVQLQNSAVPVVVQNLPQQAQGVPPTAGSPGGLAASVAGLAGTVGILSGSLGKVAATPTFVQSTLNGESTGPGVISGGGGGFFGSLGKLFGGGQNTLSIPGLNTNAGGFETGAGSPASAAQGGGSLGMLKGLGGGGKNILSQLGAIGHRAPTETVAGQGAGIGGVTGGALLAGGGILAYDGLRRGGIGGLFETTAGGAAIGAKFGGPVGALIGAGVGAIAGTIRLFVKSKAEKIIDKVKSLYHISISKPFANELAKMIDASYGGDIERGLRSTQVLNQLQLYAQSTGQQFPLAYKPYGVGLDISGGTLYQHAASLDGSSIAYGGGTAKLESPVDQLILGSQRGSQVLAPDGRTPAQNNPTQLIVQNLQLSLNGDSAAAALRGEIVNSPDQVAQANLSAMKNSSNRREITAAQTTPGLLLS